MLPVNLADKFSLIPDAWHPRIAGEFNGLQIKLVKLKGEFVWHHHNLEDELFLVFKGLLKMQLPDRVVAIREGEFFIVPKGLDHCPMADEECQIILIEPASTLNTGSVLNERTVASPEWI